MPGQLRDYQVLDVLCGGTFYKVRHKATNDIYAWRAFDCSAYSRKQIENVASDVRIISKVSSESRSLLRHHETILHAPSKTLYFVLEFSCWRSVAELVSLARATDKHIAERFVWHLLRELARACRLVEGLVLSVLRKCVSPAAIFVGDRCELRINCFQLQTAGNSDSDVMRQVGEVIRAIYDAADKGVYFSDDLHDIVAFLTDEKNVNLRPDVVLYHPTLLANLETLAGPKHLNEILVSNHNSKSTSSTNKCDSEKAVELCKAVEPAPRQLDVMDSPIYSNVSPKLKLHKEIEDSHSFRGSLSPTIAALALELPGFVPRCRKPLSQALQTYNPQKVTQETLSQQWMSRLIALRQREESLNKRERDLIAKEIVNSPATKIIPLNESLDMKCDSDTNGITLPPEIRQCEERGIRASRRRYKRSCSVRTRSQRKSYGYEDLDSSLSADPGDGSMIVTATKFTNYNMPRRNIFPDIATKKVHFASSNPFVESDESVTLTFYELENVDGDGYQVPRQEDKVLKDITKFKYLDIEKMTSEKRAAMQWNQSSPSKQPRISKTLTDITNANGIKKTPSKTSLTSKGSSSSRYSMMSCRSQLSSDSGKLSASGVAVADRTRASTRQSLAPATPPPPPATDFKKSKRKSLLPFKTPFKFMTSTKS